MPSVEIHYSSGEWAALYVDGKLVTVGDSYLAEEKIFEMFGVKVVQSDAFLRGQDQRSGVAQTLDEVEAYSQERQDRLRQAVDLRLKAEKMLRSAAELESKK